MHRVRNAQCPCCESRESDTVQRTLFECSAFAKERDAFLERLYELHPIARGLSPEGHCNFLMSDELPHKISEPSRFARPFQSRPRGVSDRLGKCPRPRRLV